MYVLARQRRAADHRQPDAAAVYGARRAKRNHERAQPNGDSWRMTTLAGVSLLSGTLIVFAYEPHSARANRRAIEERYSAYTAGRRARRILSKARCATEDTTAPGANCMRDTAAMESWSAWPSKPRGRDIRT